MKVKFTVVSCNPNQNQGFVFKLETIEQATAFGLTKTIKRTYYIGGMPEAVEVGKEFEEDIDKFEIVERPYEIVNENQEREIIYLKWLHVKGAVDKATNVKRA
jgi:hypothetical protein